VEDSERILRRFLRDGKLIGIPARRSHRRVVFDYLAQIFEPGRHYTEREVGDLLRPFHPDVAALRRYLVDEGFMDRGGGEYWRSGGTVNID
jgi:hypothetical protein